MLGMSLKIKKKSVLIHIRLDITSETTESVYREGEASHMILKGSCF